MPDMKAIGLYSKAHMPEFYAQAEQAFAFLSSRYDFRLEQQGHESLHDLRDAQAQVTYRNDRLQVRIAWYFASVIIYVVFAELHLQDASPPASVSGGQIQERHREIGLDDLAEVLGHRDDPDFVQGDTEQVDGRNVTRRFKLVQSNMPGILDGLARATERYADPILRGDTSIFPDVMAHYVKKVQARSYRPS